VGFRYRARTGLGKALLQAVLFSLGLIGVFGVLLPVILWPGSSDSATSLLLALIPFAILFAAAGSGLFLVPALWVLYLGLLAASFWRVSKVTSRAGRVVGRITIVAAFGTVYAVGWYLMVQAFAVAAMAAMVH